MRTLKVRDIKIPAQATQLDGGGAGVDHGQSMLLITRLCRFSQKEISDENIFREKTDKSVEMNTFSLISKDLCLYQKISHFTHTTRKYLKHLLKKTKILGLD